MVDDAPTPDHDRRGIDPESLSPVDRYRLSIACIVPRPIAWITTRGADGTVNLAPFSFFMGVCASPFTIAVSIAERQPPKDTLRNLRAQGEAVVHLVPGHLLDAMHQSGAEYRGTVSEAVELGLELVDAEAVAVPRLAAAEVALECRLATEIPVGDPGRGTALCLLRVVRVQVAPAVADAGGFPDPHRLQAVARLGGQSYLTTAGWTLADRARQRPPPGLGLRD
jgi:flavin reductase (DIM6/NTAB) family NADH-FMN oxidoreductase RutF